MRSQRLRDMSRLDIQVGQIVDRQQIHDVYGGRTQPRISTVKDADYLFMFIDPVGDERVGLTCGMADDGCLHVAGEGLHGLSGFRIRPWQAGGFNMRSGRLW